MRFQAFVLLAVHLNLTTAGLIRHHRLPLRPSIHARYNNVSSIAEATLQSATVSETPITPPIALKAVQTPALAGELDSTAPAPGQFGSVPAFGSGPGAATTEEAKSQTPTSRPNSFPSSTQGLKEYHGESAAATLQSAAAAPSSNATAATNPSTGQTASGSAASEPSTAPTPANTQQPAGSASVKPSTTGTASQEPAAVPTNTPNSENGNTAMALGFNSVFATLSTESPCNADSRNEVVACVGGKYATCSNGKYTLTQCPQGQQCFALPLSKGLQGVTVQCASLEEANQRLGQSSSAPAAASPSQSPSPKTQPSAAKSTATSITSVVQSPAAGSVQPSPSKPASPTAQPSAAQPSIPTTKESTQTTVSKPTSVGQQPTAAAKESTTTQAKPSATPTAPKASTTTQAKPLTTSTTTTKESASAAGTPKTTPSPNVPSPTPAEPTAAAPADDDVITVVPVTTEKVQATQAPRQKEAVEDLANLYRHQAQ